jgi:putative nucleotidyltransferase with HDIG domain
MHFAQEIDNIICKTVSECAEKLSIEVFLVGGAVRDLLLQRPSNDLDFVCTSKSEQLAKECAKKLGNPKVTIFKNYGTAHFKYNDWDIEFVAARKESYSPESRNPSVTPGTLQDDQLRRDFSINAMAISLDKNRFGELIDPFGGLQDLHNSVIRTPTHPDITFSDDPLRMMRAVRFSAQLQCTIDPECLQSIQRNAERIMIVSGERIMTEFNKIMMCPKPYYGLSLLFDCGLLHKFFPELARLQGVEHRNGIAHKDNFYHTLQVLDNVCETSNNLWLRWAALLHDIAKPPTKRFEAEHGWTFHGHEDMGARMVPKIFSRLKLPLDHQMRYVQKLVLLHLRPIALTKEDISDSAVRRLLFEAGDDIDDLMILCKADITSKNERKVKRYLSNYEILKQKLIDLEERDRIRNFQPPVTGGEIMKIFGIAPCKEVGTIKNAIKEAILEGIISNNKQDALILMYREAEKLGLRPLETN